ncbi:MAG: type II secretion system F family protein [Planctomycetota bacterium]
MGTYLAILLVLVAVALFVLYARARRLRMMALERISEDVVVEEVVDVSPQRRLVRSHRWVAPLVGLLVCLAARGGLELPWVYCISVGVILGVIAGLAEAWFGGQKIMRLETQLADAIDLMVGSLNAGSSAMDAMGAAAHEAGRPLRGLLDEISGRVRMGDNPQVLLNELAERVPLQAFRLFCFTISVHWEVGGSLAPILSGVGRSVRDRIEVSRRIRSQRANAQMSVVGILLISYFVALVMWKTNPERTRAFLETTTGSLLVALSVVLQAIGMVWMTRLSRIKL